MASYAKHHHKKVASELYAVPWKGLEYLAMAQKHLDRWKDKSTTPPKLRESRDASRARLHSLSFHQIGRHVRKARDRTVDQGEDLNKFQQEHQKLLDSSEFQSLLQQLTTDLPTILKGGREGGTKGWSVGPTIFDASECFENFQYEQKYTPAVQDLIDAVVKEVKIEVSKHDDERRAEDVKHTTMRSAIDAMEGLTKMRVYNEEYFSYVVDTWLSDREKYKITAQSFVTMIYCCALMGHWTPHTVHEFCHWDFKEFDHPRMKARGHAWHFGHAAWAFAVCDRPSDPLLGHIVTSLNKLATRERFQEPKPYVELVKQESVLRDLHLVDCAIKSNPKLTAAKFNYELLDVIKEHQKKERRLLKENPIIKSAEELEVVRLLAEHGVSLEPAVLPNGLGVEYHGTYKSEDIAIFVDGVDKYCALPDDKPLGHSILMDNLCRRYVKPIHIPVVNTADSTTEPSDQVLAALEEQVKWKWKS